MFHYGMTREQINKSSLPFIFAILNELPKRLCENIGMPYPEEDEEDEEYEEMINTSGNTSKQHPLNNTVNKEIYGKRKSKNKKEENVYYANTKQDFLDFFGGVAMIQDNS